MRDEHITEILERTPLDQLSASELDDVRAHTSHCEECRGTFDAARISALLIRERAAETFEPSPFFQTRVLAALRERQAAGEVPTLRRLWKSAGALVASMAATVALLAGLTFFAPATQPVSGSGEVASGLNAYSAEEVIFDTANATDEQLTYDQVLATLYSSDEETAR
jgi:anti-sigma factor RsiW